MYNNKIVYPFRILLVAIVCFTVGLFFKSIKPTFTMGIAETSDLACKEFSLQIHNYLPPTPYSFTDASTLIEYSVSQLEDDCQLFMVIEHKAENIVKEWNALPGVNLTEEAYPAFIERVDVYRAYDHFLRQDALRALATLSYNVVLPKNMSLRYRYQHADWALPIFTGLISVNGDG